MTEKSPFIDNYRTPKRLSEQEVEDEKKPKRLKRKQVLYVRKK